MKASRGTRHLTRADLETEAVAYHEAGHAVAAYFCEIVPSFDRVTLADRGKGKCSRREPWLPDTYDQLVEDAIVCLVGPFAEGVWDETRERVATSAVDYEYADQAVYDAADGDGEKAADGALTQGQVAAIIEDAEPTTGGPP